MLKLPQGWEVIWAVVGQLTTKNTEDLITTLKKK